jgi:hypothetical protein
MNSWFAVSYRLRDMNGKAATETFSTPAALRKAQNEVAEYHRFQELSRDLLEVKAGSVPWPPLRRHRINLNYRLQPLRLTANQ